MNHTDITIQAYNASARKYKKEVGTLTLYDETYEYFASLLPEKADILELGCGPGNVSKFITTIRPDIAVTGIDLAPAMVELARQELPDARFFVDDIRNIGSYENRYHAVIGAFCAPYLDREELESMIINCHSLLHAGGFLYLSAVGGEYDQSGPLSESFTDGREVYVFFYPREEIRSLLHAHGFVEKKLFATPFPLSDGSFSADYVFIWQKQGN